MQIQIRLQNTSINEHDIMRTLCVSYYNIYNMVLQWRIDNNLSWRFFLVLQTFLCAYLAHKHKEYNSSCCKNYSDNVGYIDLCTETYHWMNQSYNDNQNDMSSVTIDRHIQPVGGRYTVQCHSTLVMLIPIESLYATSY